MCFRFIRSVVSCCDLPMRLSACVRSDCFGCCVLAVVFEVRLSVITMVCLSQCDITYFGSIR
jgi:hypothetical protein